MDTKKDQFEEIVSKYNDKELARLMRKPNPVRRLFNWIVCKPLDPNEDYAIRAHRTTKERINTEKSGWNKKDLKHG